MQHHLPRGGFKWVEDIEMFTSDYIINLSDEAKEGYFDTSLRLIFHTQSIFTRNMISTPLSQLI